MEVRKVFDSIRDGKRTIRMNTNRREDLCMQKELEDVNSKTLSEINTRRQLKKLEPSTEDEMYLSSMQTKFVPEPRKRERKTQPVYHDNIKTKDFKPDQYLAMPTIPAYSPADTGPQMILESRSRKYPYVKKHLTTTEEMKKPRVSTLGVLPVRDSLEIPDLRVVLEGDHPPGDLQENQTRPKLYNTPATSFFVPKLQLQEMEEGDESEKRTNTVVSERTRKESKPKKDMEVSPPKKPAILPGIGTTTSVHFSERIKPTTKTCYLRSFRKKSTKSSIKEASRANTAQSFQSSLMSDEINLPDETVYNRYAEAIDHIDDDYDADDVETAVGVANKSRASVTSREGSIKSVKELLEEAKRISRADSDPLYKQEAETQKPVEKDTLDVTHRKGAKKSARSTRSSKSARSGKDGKTRDRKKSAVDDAAEPKREERTVDEIIASLKDQSAYNVETEADRKIKEIMNRVILRSTAVLDSNLEEKEDDEEAAGVDEADTFLMDDFASERQETDMAEIQELQTQDSPKEGNIADAPDVFKESMKDVVLPQNLIADESEGEGMSLTTRTTETMAASGEEVDDALDGLGPGEDDEDEEDIDRILMPWDIQQAWEDLLAPPEASAEDILSVHGQLKDMHEKIQPEPDTGAKTNVYAPSLSFISSWAPAGAKRDKSVVKPDKQYTTNNIHHFCKMTAEYQLPNELMHVGRKYHAPNKYPSIMSQRPYRFKPGEPIMDLKESASDNSEERIEQAANRVVTEANKMNGLYSLADWQGRAVEALGELDMTLAGNAVEMKNDESQVYWNPAPPKLGAESAKVRELLFSQYNIEELDDFGRVKVPAQVDEESESSEDEETEAMSTGDKEAMQRTLLKRHNSAETLTMFSREMKQLDIPENSLGTATRADYSTLEGDIEMEEEREEEDFGMTEIVTERGALEGEGTLDTQANLDPEIQSERVKQRVEEVTPRRPGTAPNLISENDDTLIVPQDFNTAMYEILEQKKLLEKAKKHIRVQEAFDELEKLEQEEKEEQVNQIHETEVVDDQVEVQATTSSSVEEELTPAEQALKAGRNYVILPKQKKKKKNYRPVDMARIEAVEKFLASKPMKCLTRHESMPKLHRMLDRDLRVPWHIRTHRSSIPNLLDFDEYKSRKRMPKGEEDRDWVRNIWNTWFDQVFPPTPDVSEGEEETEVEGEEKEDKKEKKSKKETISDILSQDIEAIEPIMDSPENAEIYQILTEEIDKLSQVIDMKHNKNAFDYCRRGALLRKIGLLKKAEQDLDQAINLEPELLDAYWHRHLLYILQDRKGAALDDLNFIMKKNKNHAGAYRSMAEIYKRQGDITMAIINYSSAIKFNPIDHEAFYQRAQLYEERGEMLLAMEDYTKAMKIFPSRTDAIMKHGMYYFENENWQNAVNDFTELLKVDPLNATARLFRGRAYAKMNSWVPSVEDLSAAIHLDPHNWQAFYQRACILRKAHPKRALQDYSVSLLLNDSEENVMSYLHRGILYDAMGKPEDAIPDFESVLKLNKDIAAAHVNLGLIYMTKHLNYHRAIKKFTSAIKVDPTYVRAYVCRAEAYHKIHEVKNALKDYTRAIHLKPDVHHFYMFRGQLVLELGNLDLAAFCVHHASELGMDSPTSTFGGSPTQQAVVQSFLKNYDKAIDALVQASRVKPIAPYFMLLGKTHMKAKQFKEAVTSFKSALEKMRPWRKRDPWPPETADAHYLSGLCHMELRNYSEALLQFNFAIKFNSSYADAYYQRGLAAVKMRQMKGIQDFNRALALNPKIFQAFLSRACYYGLKGKYAKAILNCNEAIKLQPKSVRAYLYRGSLKYHIKAYELAIQDLSKAASIDTQCPLPFFNRAVCYHENGQHDRALTDYGIVLLLGSMLSLKVLINRGLLYFEKQDYMNALFDFQAASKLSPKDHKIHHTLGLCYHKLNRLKEAVATFTHCLKLKPFFLDGITARGNVFMDYGHERGLEFARRDYQRALRLDPLCLPARINLAYTAQVSGKLMQAWKHFTAAIEVRPSYKPALEGRAIVNLQMSSTFAAYQDISKSITYGANAELLTNRGVINQFMGDPVMAMQDYQRAIKLDPKYALAYFNAANVYFHTRHFKQALEYYGKACEFNPQDESAFLNRAITKVLLHDTQGALTDFKIAAKLSPYSAHIFFNRANLYALLQQYEKAEKEYTKALELKPDDPLMLKRRADVRGKLGSNTAAIEDYKRAVHIQTRPNKVIQKK